MRRMMFLMTALFATSQVAPAFATVVNAVTAGDYLYISAQAPIDPTTGQMVNDDLSVATNLVLDHIQHWLHVKGFTMKQIVKTQVYLTDIRDFDEMNAVYGYRLTTPNARDVTVVSDLANNARLEISCVAYKHR